MPRKENVFPLGYYLLLFSKIFVVMRHSLPLLLSRGPLPAPRVGCLSWACCCVSPGGFVALRGDCLCVGSPVLPPARTPRCFAFGDSHPGRPCYQTVPLRTASMSLSISLPFLIDTELCLCLRSTVRFVLLDNPPLLSPDWPVNVFNSAFRSRSPFRTSPYVLFPVPS